MKILQGLFLCFILLVFACSNNAGLQSINYVQLCNSYSNGPTCIFNFSEQSSSNFYEFTWNNCGVSTIIRFEVISPTEIRQFYPLEATLTKQ